MASETPEEGIHLGIPFSEYCTWDAVNASLLCTVYEKTPGHARYEQENERKQTKALTIGQQTHLAVLEPLEFDNRVRVLPPDPPRRPSEKQRNAANPSEGTIRSIEFWDAWEADPRETITSKDYATLTGMIRSIRETQCKQYVVGGQAEVCLVWTDPVTKLLCKARLDYMQTQTWARTISDVKTKTGLVDRPSFMKEVFFRKYDLKAAFYVDALSLITGDSVDFIWIAVEKEPPYMCKPWRADDRNLRAGRAAYRHALDLWAKCVKENRYPGYGDDVEYLGFEQWQMESRGVGRFNMEVSPPEQESIGVSAFEELYNLNESEDEHGEEE